jgi:hypothetical protein
MRYITLVIVIIVSMTTSIFSMYEIEMDEKPKLFTIENIIEKNWGKLISVFNQPTSERLTFESKEQVTIVQIHLKWHAKEKCYAPSIQQIIKLPKSSTENIKSDTPNQNKL